VLSRRLHSHVTASLVSLFAVLALLAVPAPAQAALEAGPLEIGMYGRMGVAWNPQSGQFVHGKTLNLLGNTLGGRLEEGDYLEPNIKLHIARPTAEDNTKPYMHFVLTPAMFSSGGSFLGAFANNFSTQLRIELFQAYLEAGNVLIPDLKIWAGQRFYRGSDVHIADYYYFNQLNSQGFGVKYKALDVAVLLQTGSSGQYSVDLDGDPDTEGALQRQRTVLVGQYVLPVAEKHSVQFLGEFHLLPAARPAIGSTAASPSDIGYVLGVKGRLDLGNGSFNELAVRYGGGIANGSFNASPTWSTYGFADEEGKYGGALGLEVVDHFLYNVNPLFAVNAFGIVQFSKGASGESTDKAFNFAVGARTFLYLHNQFHLINELTYHGFGLGIPEGAPTPPLPTAVKFTVMPTIVPSGERSVWARPHLRLIYTVAHYSQGARDLLASPGPGVAAKAGPYLNTFGPREWGHYLGARAEWWF
jgi:maltoporin